MGDQPFARPLPTQDNTNTEHTQTNIHALSGVRTHDPSIRAGENSSCLRKRCHSDRDHLYTPLETILYGSLIHTDLWLQSITISISRFLATDLTQWRFFSFRGHAVTRWLTLHTWTHSAIFSANSRLTAHLGTPELDWTLLYNHFARTEQKTQFPTIPILLCLPTVS
jgi:hypothetical protein